jgi:6,7-dimethyl-8-ribityllumazine synthase
MFGAEQGRAATLDGSGLTIGIVQARFNESITDALAQACIEELRAVGVAQDRIEHVRVPGALEVPIALQALAERGGFDALVALGCVIRGETAHFEYISGEAASGLQLAALETGVPVAFGVLTVDTAEQAEARIDKGGEAVRTALEVADLFSQLRSTAQAS